MILERRFMKFLFSILLGGIVSSILIYLDVRLVLYLLTLVPLSHPLSGLFKIAIIFVDIWFTLGICVLPFFLGGVIGTALEK
jgi:hypothetical protein